MYCEKCGKEIADNAVMCPQCGTIPDGSQLRIKSQKKRHGCLISFCVFLGIITIPIIISLFSNSDMQASSANTGATEVQSESKEDFMESCQVITFKELGRNPDKYKGQRFEITGQVIQVSETSDIISLRLNMTKGEYGIWDDTIYATVSIPKESDRILEDDIIRIYGTCDGQYTYTSVFGASISLPKIDVKYYQIETE